MRTFEAKFRNFGGKFRDVGKNSRFGGGIWGEIRGFGDKK